VWWFLIRAGRAAPPPLFMRGTTFPTTGCGKFGTKLSTLSGARMVSTLCLKRTKVSAARHSLTRAPAAPRARARSRLRLGVDATVIISATLCTLYGESLVK
jgi:hypothetical protein